MLVLMTYCKIKQTSE